jgi:hypothetical protein
MIEEMATETQRHRVERDKEAFSAISFSLFLCGCGGCGGSI